MSTSSLRRQISRELLGLARIVFVADLRLLQRRHVHEGDLTDGLRGMPQALGHHRELPRAELGFGGGVAIEYP